MYCTYLRRATESCKYCCIVISNNLWHLGWHGAMIRTITFFYMLRTKRIINSQQFSIVLLSENPLFRAFTLKRKKITITSSEIAESMSVLPLNGKSTIKHNTSYLTVAVVECTTPVSANVAFHFISMIRIASVRKNRMSTSAHRPCKTISLKRHPRQQA